MSRDISCQVCYVIWADIGFRNAHVSVFPALAGSPPSRIYAEVLIRGVCKDSYDVRAAPCESFIVRRKGADTMPQYRAQRNYENLNKGIFQGTMALGTPYIAPEDCAVETGSASIMPKPRRKNSRGMAYTSLSTITSLRAYGHSRTPICRCCSAFLPS